MVVPTFLWHSKYRLTVSKVKLIDRSTVTVDTNCTVPQGLTGHTCLINDQLMKFTCNSLIQRDFVYTFTGCQNISIALTALVGDTDVYVSLNNTSPRNLPGSTSVDVASIYYGDDIVFISVCPQMGQSGILYISSDCWELANGVANYTLLVTSHQSTDTWKTTAIKTLSVYAAVSELVNTIKIRSPANDYYCYAWAWNCYEIWTYSSSLTANPIYPLPEKVKFDFYRYMLLAAPVDQIGVVNTLNFAILLNYTLLTSSVTNFMESDLSTLKVELLPKLSNMKGEGIQNVIYSLSNAVQVMAPMTSTSPMVMDSSMSMGMDTTPATTVAHTGSASLLGIGFALMLLLSLLM